MDLAELMNHYGSDKDVNGYAQLYHTLFAHLRDEPLSFLEIGIGTMLPGVHSSMQGYALAGYRPGGSLRAWRDYFPKASILGADVQLDTQFEDDRIKTILCNSTNADDVASKLGGRVFDIIVDDGSHLDTDQFKTLANFFPLLRDGGLYVIEDIYPGSSLSRAPHLLEEPAQRNPFFFVGVSNNLCVIYKQPLRSNRRGY